MSLNPYSSEYNAVPESDAKDSNVQPELDHHDAVAQPNSYGTAAAQPQNYNAFTQPNYYRPVHQPDYNNGLYQPVHHHAAPQQNNYNANNFYGNPTIQIQGQWPPRAVPQADSASDGDDIEVGTKQYSPLPPPRPFLSVEEFEESDDELYTEIQIGVEVNPQASRQPKCDNCESRPRNGRQPIVYICPNCDGIPNRPLCKKCAQEELRSKSSCHKPDHNVRKWQPTWRFNFKDGLDARMLSPEMEELAQEIPDKIRTLQFESCRDFDEKAIRLFLPSPRGSCRIEVQIQVKSIINERRHKGIFDAIKGGSSEVVGSVRMSAYPFALSSPRIPPRGHIPKSRTPHLSASIDIKRDADLTKLRSLVVTLDTGLSPGGGVELVIQDEDRESKKFEDHPFKWVLRNISITHEPEPTNFASLAQKRQYKTEQDNKNEELAKRKKERTAKDEQKKKDYKERVEARLEDKKKEKEKEEEKRQAQETIDHLAQIRAIEMLNEHQRGRQAHKQDFLHVPPNAHLRSSSVPSNATSTPRPVSQAGPAPRPPMHPSGAHENPYHNMTGGFSNMHLHPTQTRPESRERRQAKTGPSTNGHFQSTKKAHSASPNRRIPREPATPYRGAGMAGKPKPGPSTNEHFRSTEKAHPVSPNRRPPRKPATPYRGAGISGKPKPYRSRR